MSNKLKPKYRRGDVFTIEIAEVHTHYDDQGKPYSVYRVKGFKSLFLDDYALDKLGKDNIQTTCFNCVRHETIGEDHVCVFRDHNNCIEDITVIDNERLNTGCSFWAEG